MDGGNEHGKCIVRHAQRAKSFAERCGCAFFTAAAGLIEESIGKAIPIMTETDIGTQAVALLGNIKIRKRFCGVRSIEKTSTPSPASLPSVWKRHRPRIRACQSVQERAPTFSLFPRRRRHPHIVRGQKLGIGEFGFHLDALQTALAFGHS
jgi:hypothetical protein